jgi:hypothetical protein
VDSRFYIKAQHIPDALDAINHLDPKVDETYQPGGHKTLAQALEAQNWHVGVDTSSGDIISIRFVGRKHSEHFEWDVYLPAIARFVEPGSYIEMVGEDDERWRFAFNGASVQTIKPTITW